MSERRVSITIEIDATTTLDDEALERRLENLVDPEELEAQAVEDDERTEFLNTSFRFSEPAAASDPLRMRASFLSVLPGGGRAVVADEELRKAANLEAILDWVDARRPDVSAQVREILSRGWVADQAWSEALTFLLTIGFAAGRKYQHAHAELSPDVYHRL